MSTSVAAGARGRSGVRVDQVQAAVVASVSGFLPRTAHELEALRARVTTEARRPCLGRPTEDHYPPMGSEAPSPAVLERERARARELCAGCPVLVECRALELAAEPWGVWGGVCQWDLQVAARAIRAAKRVSRSSDQGGAGAGLGDLRSAS